MAPIPMTDPEAKIATDALSEQISRYAETSRKKKALFGSKGQNRCFHANSNSRLCEKNRHAACCQAGFVTALERCGINS